MYTQYAKIVKRRCTGTKKASDFSEAFERKTRLEPIYEKGSRNIRNPFERKTRLELATPTLARSCSTN